VRRTARDERRRRPGSETLNPEARLDALLSVPALHGPQVSPDGERVAWSWSRLGPAADVFAAPTDGSKPPVRLTDTPDDTLVVSWTPDGAAVVVGQDRDGDERTRLFMVRLEGPETMEPLTEEAPNYYVRGGQLHPNGRWLIYGANLDAGSGREIEETWIYRHDLRTGERIALARPERGNFYAPQLNLPGDAVLYHRNDLDPEGLQAWLVGVDGEDDREILNFGPKSKTYASWFPDGRRILYVTETGSHRRLGVWEDGSARWLIDDENRDVEYAFVPPNGGPVVVAEVERARTRATLLDPESGDEKRVPDPGGNLIPLAPRDDGTWTGLHYDARSPVDLVAFDPDGDPESITGLWQRIPLEPASLVPAQEFAWSSVDGLEVRGWLYRTRRESVGTVVLIHGGPTSHAEDRFNAQIQYLLSRGFDVLAPNYRGSTGYGLGFQEMIKEDGWGGREQEDIKCGIEALIEAGVARRGRVGVTGTSYGGYSAWWAITHYGPDLVAAAAPICGMTDLVVDYYATRPDLRPYSEEMMGGSPEEVPERYRARSPIHSAKNIRSKLLIVQGLKDPNVTPENVHAVTRALDRENVPYDLLTFEDEGHGIARPKNLKILYPRLADFFESSFKEPALPALG
jgi:dipeptidyl aminopeptidase/acylaminoacyl peptidase